MLGISTMASILRFERKEEGSKPSSPTNNGVYMKTEAWWVCDKCLISLVKVSGKNVNERMYDHRKIYHPIACFSIKQIPQKKL